jgi:uncharacterized protein YuzB (UPF0349 family)
MKIRFCKGNKGKNKVMQRLEEAYPDVNIKAKDCIKKCGPCKKGPMAVVDGKTVVGVDGDDLYTNIVMILENKAPKEDYSLSRLE